MSGKYLPIKKYPTKKQKRRQISHKPLVTNDINHPPTRTNHKMKTKFAKNEKRKKKKKTISKISKLKRHEAPHIPENNPFP
jgi:hypothetical protein